jgi:protein O-GlcNAc transferase
MSYSHPTVLQAIAHHQAGRNPQARQLLVRLLQREPKNAEALHAAVEFSIALQEPEPARLYAQRLVDLAPQWPDAWVLRAQAEVCAQKLDDAVPFAERAVALDPGNPDRHRTLAWVLHRARRFRRAAEAAAAGLALDPRDADLWQKRAVALQTLGRAEEAAAVFEQGVAACPDSLLLAEGFAFLSNYLPNFPLERARALHRRAADLLTQRHPPMDPPAPAPRTLPPGQPLRVGLLSPDLRTHSVGFFAQSLILNHDPAELDIFVYSTAGRDDDALTLRLKAALSRPGRDRWRYFAWPDPDTIAQAIRADGLDLLIELSGLTRDHNLPVVARKPAPRIATYLGYPSPTSLPTVDAHLVDRFTDPEGPRAGTSAASSLGPHPSALSANPPPEPPAYIDPCFIAYTPPAEPPPITWTPPTPGSGAASRPLVFGSFNNLMKLNDVLLARWARLLAAVPESVLALKAPGLHDAGVRDDLLARAAAAGIAPDRLRVLAPIDDPLGHIAAYNDIDVALDTFPYHGTTTTCEALLMGVPVITIEGDRHASRVGVSLLNNAGLPEFIAQSFEHMTELASDLIRDTPRLTTFRQTIRARFLASPVCDARSYAAAFAKACRALARA